MMVRKPKAPGPAARRRAVGFSRLYLYVTGWSARSLATYANLKAICDSRMQGCYRITVIDIAEQPQRAKVDQICATPVVIRKHPKPIRTVIGNLSDLDRVLVGLNMTPTT